jgi:hypothetical protein
MSVHIIPESEPELHQTETCCPCEPVFKLDKESGEMVWVHRIIDAGRIIDQLINI